MYYRKHAYLCHELAQIGRKYLVCEWARILREMILDAPCIARISTDIKPSVVNCTLLIVNFTLFWAFRLSPSGFPLYLFPLRSKRMPLQSLTHGGCHKTNASLELGHCNLQPSHFYFYLLLYIFEPIYFRQPFWQILIYPF